MNLPAQQILLRAAALATVLALGACGGGGDSSPQQPVAQTITFTSPGDQALGATPAALVATSTSGLTVSFASSTPGVCTVSGTTLTLTGVGTCTLGASQAGNSTYAAAAPVSHSVAVAPGAQTISFISPGNQTLGTTPAALVATASSGLSVSFSSTTPGICTVNGTALTLVSVGTCTVGASQAGNASYNAAAPVFHNFDVAAALLVQNITFNSPGNQTLGTAPAALAATSTSNLPVSFASTTPSVCTVSGSTLTLVAAGSCTVAASQAGNGTYAAATMVSQSFPVAPTAQTITFISPGNKTLGTPPFTLVATSTSGLPVSFASTTPSCTVSGNTLTLVAAGTCTVNASQAGNASFAAATPVPQTFTVSAAALLAQDITFAPLGNKTLGTAPFTLVATSTSNLIVSFTSGTPSCTVSGTTLTLVAVGDCTVVASQDGNSTYAAAAQVPRTFTVAPALAGPELMANGGMETPASLAGQFAQGWRGVNSQPAAWSLDARTGIYSAAMAVPDPGFGGSGLVQNAVDDGGLASILNLYVGKTTILTFWAKGNASSTGNVNYSLRYLNSNGNILNPVVNTSFGNLINANTWTKISLNGPAIPATTSAIFLEMTLAVGPTGVVQCGVDNITGLPVFCDNGQAKVLIDDVSVTVVP